MSKFKGANGSIVQGDPLHAMVFRARRKQAERPSLLLRGLFAHGTAEEFGQCGIEGGAGLLLDLL